MPSINTTTVVTDRFIEALFSVIIFGVIFFYLWNPRQYMLLGGISLYVISLIFVCAYVSVSLCMCMCVTELQSQWENNLTFAIRLQDKD